MAESDQISNSDHTSMGIATSQFRIFHVSSVVRFFEKQLDMR
jgi:hypothetical protein